MPRQSTVFSAPREFFPRRRRRPRFGLARKGAARHDWNMSNQPHLAGFVSLHPYFKVHPGKLADFKTGMQAMVEKTRAEAKNLFYDFTVNAAADEVFCREAYTDAAGLLAHLENVDALLKEALTLADLVRLEVHGPADELAKLKAPLADFKPAWFAHACGVTR